jgi:general secretion pathway protein I
MKIDCQSNADRTVRGFTLIEVLAALMICGLLIGSAVLKIGEIAVERTALQERLAAETVAWNKLMEQYQLVEGWVERTNSAESSGSEEAIGRSWDWRLEAESTLAEDFYRYQVQVFPEGSSETNTWQLAAYFIVD